MKKISRVILVLIMIVNLTACGGKEVATTSDPNVGMWNAVSASMGDTTLVIAEVFDKGASLDLKANGKFDFVLDGDKSKGKWSYKDDGLILSHKEGDFKGKVENGILTLINMLDSGLDLSFEKEAGSTVGKPAKKMGDAGYYVIEKAIESGETMTAEEMREMDMFAYVLLSEDGTFVISFGEDDVDVGVWEKGILNFQNEKGEVEESIDYTLKGDEMTIDWGGDFIVIYVRSNETPPVHTSSPSEGGGELSEFQQLWDGEWYGYWEAHSVTDDYINLDDARYDCYAVIEMNSDDTGTINLWEREEDFAIVEISVSQDGGPGEMGAAVSESGHYWDGLEIGHADWIIDPSIYKYEDYMVIEGRYVDADDEGFYYNVYLRPWGMLWEDIEDIDERPPWYNYWYMDNYTGSMLEAVYGFTGYIPSELPQPVIKESKPSTPSSNNGGGVQDISGEIIDVGIISALCPDGWKNYDVPDYFSDDVNAIAPDMLEFHKKGKGEDDQFDYVGLDIQYYKNGFSEDRPTSIFDGAVEDWGPIDLGNRTWEGFVGLDEKRAHLWSYDGEKIPMISILMNLELEGETISLDDEDVLAIIASIKVQ